MRGRSPFLVALLVLLLSLAALAPPGASDETDPESSLRLEPMLEERAATGITIPVLLHFRSDAARDAALPRFTDAYPLEVLSALVIPSASFSIIRSLGDIPGALYAEAGDKPLRYALDSARRASRADLVTGDDVRQIAGMTLRDGTPIDGRGIGIAIIDSGVDRTHPDLESRIGGSWVVTEAGVAPITDTDPLSPHGTHMAGILAGTGAVDPAVRGVAPGATVYSFDIGPATNNLFAARAFEWIIQNKDNVEPPIRVVVNAWGCFTGPCRTYDPAQAHNALATRLAENGTIVVFPVGNIKGNGFVSTVNPEATNPTPGVLGVGDYDDRDIGTRLGCTSGTSARGAYDDATTWPDLIAPGSWTWSPNGVFVGEDTRVPETEHKTYNYFHGTSAAAAHLGGIAALTLQAAPLTTPREFEYAAKATADKNDCNLDYVRADPTHPWDGTHPRLGHGLVDAQEIVEMAMKGVRIPKNARDLEAPPPEWLAQRVGTDVQHTFYLRSAGSLDAQYPTSEEPAVHHVSSSAPVLFETAPFLTSLTASSVRLDLWWGTFKECVCIRANVGLYGAHLDVVRFDGTVERLGTGALNSWFVHPAGPTQRHMDLQFPEVTVGFGDRLRVTVAVITPPTHPIVGTDFILYTDSPQTASRVALGDETGPKSGDAIWCQVRQDCTDVGGDRLVEGLHCDGVPMRVEWYGPPGSSIILTCSGLSLSCTVPYSLTGTWSRCSADSIVNPSPVGDKVATCRYTTADGSRVAGLGRCQGLLPSEGGD